VGLRRALAVAAVIVAASTLAGVSKGPEAAAADPPVFTLPPFPGDGGVLRLHLGAQDYFRFDAKNTAGPGYVAGTQELITTSGCNIVAPFPTSMTLTPAPNGGSAQGRLGLVADGIGVQVKGEGNGTPCGQANGTTQSLDLKLAGALANSAIDFAELDVEGKFGVTIKAELFLDGQPAGTELLVTSGPDSGPDSGDNDNFRWRLPAAPNTGFFDEVKLSVDGSTPSGAFSLEGGADGTSPEPGGLGTTLGTTDSLFHIAGIDGELACGATASEAGTNGAPSASITLQNVAGCEPVVYSLSVSNTDGNQAVAFQKIGGDNNIYRATITWPVEASAYPVPPTQIRYGDGPAHNMLWCDGTPSAPVKPAANEFWCIVDHHAALAGTDLMQVTEELFGQGDPGAWR
jgi:hypothetical protein